MLKNIILHRVGNKINQENIYLSAEELDLDDHMKEMLTDFFLKGFKSEEHFRFYSDTYLEDNPVFSSCAKIFENPDCLLEESEKLARLLYDAAQNPRVQGGELFVCYFTEADEEDAALSLEKIGIFKTEKKEPFLKIYPQNDALAVEEDAGISLSKPQKGCLVYQTDKENGFALSVYDNNKNGDEYYWYEDFLKVKQKDDDYFHTQETLSVYKDFITKQLPQEFEVSKADQADFLHKSLEFFKEKQEFDIDTFASEVIEDQEVIESFIQYKTEYEQDTQSSISEQFPINPAAVKKNQRHFKSVIKLDKNFHIYVHGDRKMIEQGQDEKGKYYRLYFEEEK